MRTKRITTFILCLALAFVIGGEAFFSAFSVKASAETVTSTNVLDDLSKDDSFSSENYPSDANDYSMNIIQVAEGVDGRLFVYVYQPNFEYSGLKAAYINMSLQDQTDNTVVLSYKLYSLTFLNSNGSLCKYVVNDFVKSDDMTRYYSISAIYRPYLEGIDSSFEAIDLVNYVKYTVGRMWCSYMYNNEIIYEAVDIDTVTVTITASGEIRYRGGYLLHYSDCNSHYFAFKVEGYDVSHIYDADVTYKLIPYSHTTTTDPKIDEERDVISVSSKPLYDTDLVTFDQEAFLSKKYTWKRIQTTQEFFDEITANKITLNDTEISDIKKSQFVFRIAESNYFETVDFISGFSVSSYYRLDTAGVLRLHFATPQGVYNLGAVSDLVGTDGIADGMTVPDYEGFFNDILTILTIVLILVVVIALASPLSFIGRVVINAFKFVFNFVISIVSIPFYLIGRLFSKK